MSSLMFLGHICHTSMGGGAMGADHPAPIFYLIGWMSVCCFEGFKPDKVIIKEILRTFHLIMPQN